MLSISVIKSTDAVYSYYETDNYYAKDSPEAKETTHWWGLGAMHLKLEGFVDPELFNTLLEGRIVDQQLGRTEGDKIEHRPGYDLTFSAPKSVSILSEVGEDKRIHSAHDKAVNAALGYLEKHAAQTRRSEDGKIIFENTNNFIVAKFRHDTSREQDPQLHTHCVLMNATQRSDGEWRSLSSEKIFDHKMLAGLIYRSHLAVELQNLGYEINKTHSDGRFEVVHIPQDIIDVFSKRREEIEKSLVERGLEGAKASEIATLTTRKNKQEIDRNLLHQDWQSQCKVHEFDVKKVIETAIEKSTLFNSNSRDEAYISVRYANKHLSEREAVFPQQQVLSVALAHGLGKVLPDQVEKAILALQEKGELIQSKQKDIDAPCWTTPEALRLEQDTINQMLDGRFALKPITSTENAERFLSDQSHLNAGQKEAIKLILTTPDKIVGVQGYAGTGKTTMLATLKEFANHQGFEVKGIAPSAAAANQLREGAGIDSATLDSYLLEHAKQGNYIQSASKVIWILDESSMASTTKMNELLVSVHQNKGRLVLIGDTKQLGAIEAGKPFYQLQKIGMQVAVMQTILRQKDPKLLEAVHKTIKGDIRAALDKIGDKVIEIENKEKRIERLAHDYLAMSPEQRQRTLVLTPANEDRQKVNELIREGLKQEKYLKGDERVTTTLVNRGFTQAERIHVDNYSIGDIVRFNKSYNSLGINNGDYLEVSTIDKNHNKIILKNSQGNLTDWQPDQIGGRRQGAIEVYQQEQRGLMIGDTIQWQRNDKHQGIINSEKAQVLSVKNDSATVEFENGKIIKINTADRSHQHWDHAYATTVHAAQGKTCDIVLAHGESFRKNLTNQQGFYVTISRSRQQVFLYTDNKMAYIKALNKYSGEKTSIIDFSNIENRELKNKMIEL